ncbi:helix-turn-helix domain-containing protein [Priestia megaterium]|jgi:predicted XRE-type DNA-binding protein|uniref:helix-turn-helix domain-containing protein n=1 Tax=Priestia TaxID=2800373 RepID=UPI0005C6DC0A|nr:MULTISPECIES: helix-turn-helix transcriptional regulator [Priestia]MBX9996923.1 helix-turn-helix transcriptional regulator [Priestia aryabhattai]MCF8890760.1 helix-turn-helix domain-containing protein [Priestia megaterium]MDW4512068.1 helix-turn-helix transcriptional regulator [Priestia megaterium]NEW00502.1 helix-turn-helix transcriptional regulator [Priestia megaterium]NGY81011.1 helix-turn-helix transcriptional regulator [Priestia megaterium]
MFGLGKQRSKLGKWLDQRGISQQWLASTSKVSRSTVSELCKRNVEHAPTQRTMTKILKALRKIDPNLKAHDFFDM